MNAMYGELTSSLQGTWRALRPALLDEFAMAAALEGLADAARLRRVPAVDVDIDPEVERSSGRIGEVVVLVAQEALAHVPAHAMARRCLPSVAVEDHILMIDVTDDGVSPRGRHGFKLRLLAVRVRWCGGNRLDRAGSDRRHQPHGRAPRPGKGVSPPRGLPLGEGGN